MSTQSINKTNVMRDYDVVLVSCVVGLLLFGLVMVYSSSIALVEATPKYIKATGGDSWYYFNRQLIFIGAGLVAAWIFIKIPMSVLYKYSLHAWFLGLILLCMVFFFDSINGAKRWIVVFGLTFQPSELMKIIMVLAISTLVVNKDQDMGDWRLFVPQLIFYLAVIILILLEPDLGAAVVIALIAIGIIFLSPAKLRVFVFASFIVVVFIFLAVYYEPYRLERFLSYQDPFDQENFRNHGRQLGQSLLAIDKGDWFGSGIGASVIKVGHLPEPHTDFIGAVIVEEFGVLGLLVILCVFARLIWRIFDIGRDASALSLFFNSLVAKGVGIWLMVQSLWHLAVCVGLMPTKGLTLPFISYGGSALLISMISIAIVMRVDYENRRVKRGASVEEFKSN